MSPQIPNGWKTLRLHHQTINTGHVLVNRLAEMTQPRPGTKVSIDAVRPLAAQIPRMLSTELVPVHELSPAPAPDFQAYAIRGFPDLGVTRPVFVVYAHPDCSEAQWTQTMDEPIPLVTFGVGVQGDTGPLWQYLCRVIANIPGFGFPDAIDPESPPPTPWCGVGLHVPLLLGAYPDALHWLGDFERCVAWAAVLHAGGCQFSKMRRRS